MRSGALLFSGDRRISARLTERPNDEWVALLGSPGSNGALEELRTVIVRGLRFGLRGRLERHGAVEMIEDFTQEALLKILENLDNFRGESRFTTWAQKIAMRVAFSELRRKRWENVSLDQLLDGDEHREGPARTFPDPDRTPDNLASDRMMIDLVTAIIENELTELQRRALRAIVIHGMPMEEVARKLGTNRNALYKLLHDARRKVKRELERRGIDVRDVIAEL